MGSVTALMLVVGLLTLIGSSLQTQRLIGLRHQAADLEVELAETRAEREGVRARLIDARRYERIAERARVELGMIESSAEGRRFVSMPTSAPEAAPGLVDRLARRLDRFAEVRASNAAEREQ